MTLDLPRIQRALGRIRRILTDHPELRERTRDYLAGDLPERKDTDDDPQDQEHRGT